MSKTKVLWLPWSKITFKKAQELDKPVLLGISAVWCHWCHIMDQTTYSDSEVAKLIEEKFVPIRVDRDQRPDIDKRYNMGGWPSTAFLTPDGEILMGGTYIPPQQMKSLLNRISRLYKQNKDSLKSRMKKLEKERRETPSIDYGLDRGVFQSIVDGLTLEIASRFDPLHGGFGGAPKFPHSGALRLALLEHQIQGHKAALSIVKKTLMEMRAGGIFDQQEGGFFRYSTTRDWSIPHYEKMCEDNAQLLINYLEAYQVTGEETFRDTAKGILAYVNAKLSNQEEGGFYGSQDADEEYYRLNLQERQKRTAPKIDTTLFTNWNGMMVSAYLLASVVLEEPSYQKFALRTVNLLLETSFNPSKGMFHYRVKGKSHLPGLLTDQVHMIKCLVDSYQITSERKFLDHTESLANYMLRKLWNDRGGFNDKPKENSAFGALKTLDKPLDDNSVAADALLRLHHLTGKKKYLETARKTLEYFAPNYQRYGIMAAVYGLAVEYYLHPMEVQIVGPRNDPVTQEFRSKSLRAYNPLKVVEVIDPSVDTEKLRKLKYPVTEKTRAYICFKGTCNSVEDPEELVRKIGG
jgi:uncharacterized protein YyaL (SSP411 family)